MDRVLSFYLEVVIGEIKTNTGGGCNGGFRKEEHQEDGDLCIGTREARIEGFALQVVSLSDWWFTRRIRVLTLTLTPFT